MTAVAVADKARPSAAAKARKLVLARKSSAEQAPNAPRKRPPGVPAEDFASCREFERQVLASELKAHLKVVAIALAHRFNTKTGQLNPSYDTIAGDAGLKKRRAIDSVSALIDAGWIDCSRSSGRLSNHYRLLLNSAAMLHR